MSCFQPPTVFIFYVNVIIFKPKFFILGGRAIPVVEHETLDDITQYAQVQCQVTKYVYLISNYDFGHTKMWIF